VQLKPQDLDHHQSKHIRQKRMRNLEVRTAIQLLHETKVTYRSFGKLVLASRVRSCWQRHRISLCSLRAAPCFVVAEVIHQQSIA
jgi:hypothetical protein